jgi:DNA primase large subunit
MEEEEKFNERFETIEQTLKYIAETQAKSEWLHKQEQIARRKFEEESQKRWEQTQKQLDYITKLTGIAFEDLMFQDEKLEKAGKILGRKRTKKT